MTDLLRVKLNGSDVGTLTLLASGNSFFAFDDAYLNNVNRPVLSQSFFRASGDIIPETRVSRSKLPVFFSNLLPEGHMRDYLAERGGIKPSQEFKLLQLLGKDLPGALFVSPIGENNFFDLEKTQKLEPKESQKPYRFSLAGVQLKFSALAQSNGGLTIPASGIGGNWILKLPAQNYAYVPENEFAMMHLAGEIGIPIPKIKLVSLTDVGCLPEMGVLVGSQALAVKRFDRAENGRHIHIEDFAQVYNIYPDKKYEGVSFANVTNMIWALTGETGLIDFIRRLTFTILIGNGDMHLKNWSFLYEDERTPMLSPAYDMVSTIPYIPNDGLALKLANTKDMRVITLEHFKKMASKAQVPEHLVLQTVRETVAATTTAWETNYKHYELPKDILERIQKHMSSLVLTSQYKS